MVVIITRGHNFAAANSGNCDVRYSKRMSRRCYQSIVVPFRSYNFRVHSLMHDHVSPLKLQWIGPDRGKVFLDGMLPFQPGGHGQCKGYSTTALSENHQ